MCFSLGFEAILSVCQTPYGGSLGGLVGLLTVVVAGLYATSLSDWKDTSLYPRIIRSYKTPEMLAQVAAPGVVLMASAYTPASIYGHSLRQYVPVFGPGNFHARQDDMLVDFSLYQGKTVRIVRMDAPQLDDYRPYFDSVQVLSYTQDGVPFYAVEGRGFNYVAYRDGVLATIYRHLGIDANGTRLQR